MKDINFRYFLFLIPILLIMFSWFSTGRIISNNSEENLNILNPKKSAEYYSTSLYPIGTGVLIPLHIGRYPAFLFLSYFQNLGLPPFLIQGLFLGIIMLVGVLAMYLLINKGFEMVWQVAAIGSIFYLLNLYSMTQIWKRFLYNGMISWAYLPLFLFLWMKSFTSSDLKWPILFLLISPIFSYTFSHPAYFFTFWIPTCIFLIFQLPYFKLKKLDILRLIFKAVVIFFLWILINIWWIYPLFKTGGSYMTENIPNWQANFDSLLGVSKYFGTLDILLLRQKAYFEKGSPLSAEWFYFYNNFFSFLISLALFAIVILGIIKSNTQRYFKYLFSLLLIGWFISKGSNFPFGYTFFYLLFKVLPSTATLRNPYEKFGTVYLLAYSVFFAFGFYFIISKLKSKWRYLITSFMTILFFGILVYPMWNGDMFPPKHRLNIPADYSQANEYLKSVSSNRVFFVPFTTVIEKVRFKWGYEGEDPSENLIESQTITEAYVPIMKNVYELIPKYLDNKNLPMLLGLLGADHIILRKDLVYPDPIPTSLRTIENFDTVFGVTKDKEIGDLVLYGIDKDLVKPIIFATKLEEVQSTEEGLNKVVNGEIKPRDSGFVNVDIPNTGDILPIINYTEVSSTHYRVMIKEASSPFSLVLNNTYDNLWQARIEKDIVTQHFIANGFANGWFIDKRGNFSIEIVLKIWPWD